MSKILIVDDEPFIRTLLEETLEEFEDEGVELLVACNGIEGWKIVQQERPNLVFLDVIMVMPEEGVHVSREIAEDPELRDIPVVMVSSIVESGLSGHFPTDRPLHVHKFLDKPIPLQELLDVANSFVQQT